MAGVKKITTPRGTIISVNGMEAKLTWNADFAKNRNEQFTKAQKYVDSEVLRLDSPRVPLDTGMLEKSGTLGTEVGSGEVQYIAPYAAAQYYDTSETRSYDPQRGGKWFERMKAADGDDILRGAQKLMK